MLRTVLLVSLLLTLVLSQGEEDVIIGIDLGTTYSCVSYWESNWDRVDLIPNGQGQMITPSVIAFNPENGELLVGAAAKNQAAMNPANTVYDAKRYHVLN
jgi:molecular chaperone DnaK (HSP70)